MKRYIIVGLGIFGGKIAATLYENGHDVVALDTREERINRISGRVTRAVVGDGRQLEVLKGVGAQGADAAVVSTGDDLSASILVAMALRDVQVRETYVKVISTDHARIMRKLGVTEIIFPEEESAFNLGMRILRSDSLLNYVRLGGGLSLQEMAVPAKWEGRTLRELALPSRYRVSVVAVHDIIRDEMNAVPNPDEPLLDAHTLVLTGTEENLARVAGIA